MAVLIGTKFDIFAKREPEYQQEVTKMVSSLFLPSVLPILSFPLGLSSFRSSFLIYLYLYFKGAAVREVEAQLAALHDVLESVLAPAVLLERIEGTLLGLVRRNGGRLPGILGRLLLPAQRHRRKHQHRPENRVLVHRGFAELRVRPAAVPGFRVAGFATGFAAALSAGFAAALAAGFATGFAAGVATAGGVAGGLGWASGAASALAVASPSGTSS